MRLPTLRRQARWMPWAQFALAAAALLAGSAILIFHVLPLASRLQSVRAADDAMQRQEESAQADAAALRPEARQIGPLRMQLAADRGTTSAGLAHGSGLDATTGSDYWIRRMTDMSRRDRLTAVTVQAGETKCDGHVWRLPLILNFEGDYLDVLSFLRDAERLPPTVRVSTLHVHCTNLATGQVQVQVAMNAYWPGE